MLLALPLMAFAESRINDPDVKSLQVVVNDNWLAPAIMRLDSHDVLTVSFDELSHDYHRYIYKLEHCEADWTPSEGIFESDWLSGFNGNTIDDYQHSTNTIIPYTHYQLQLPNARCSLKISGNYRLHVLDEDDDNREVLVAEFMVTEQKMKLSMSATGNTDVDTRQSHQQDDLLPRRDGSIAAEGSLDDTDISLRDGELQGRLLALVEEVGVEGFLDSLLAGNVQRLFLLLRHG